ncbi:hypothetical protein [Parabacteroides pacaensis]|nr:hypothetical protein [Parabacteroides pacaensis]
MDNLDFNFLEFGGIKSEADLNRIAIQQMQVLEETGKKYLK